MIIFIMVLRYRMWKRREAKTVNIKNPTVILIGIGFHDNNVKNKEFRGYCPDLDGVRFDIKNSIDLFGKAGLHYDVCQYYGHQYIDNYKAFWSKDEFLEFLKKTARQLDDNLDDECINYQYDVIMSCHGKRASLKPIFTSASVQDMH